MSCRWMYYAIPMACRTRQASGPPVDDGVRRRVLEGERAEDGTGVSSIHSGWQSHNANS